VRGPLADVDERAARALERVGLTRAHLDRFPHELSGGERQRLCITRALATEPRILVLDEALTALDVSVRAHVANLLVELRAERALSCLFIAHDLEFVRWFADRIAVLDAGRIVEIGPVERVFEAPEHACTRALLEASLA
jgi:ABC-type oligopeptide transport system ATPase subunit